MLIKIQIYLFCIFVRIDVNKVGNDFKLAFSLWPWNDVILPGTCSPGRAVVRRAPVLPVGGAGVVRWAVRVRVAFVLGLLLLLLSAGLGPTCLSALLAASSTLAPSLAPSVGKRPAKRCQLDR